MIISLIKFNNKFLFWLKSDFCFFYTIMLYFLNIRNLLIGSSFIFNTYFFTSIFFSYLSGDFNNAVNNFPEDVFIPNDINASSEKLLLDYLTFNMYDNKFIISQLIPNESFLTTRSMVDRTTINIVPTIVEISKLEHLPQYSETASFTRNSFDFKLSEYYLRDLGNINNYYSAMDFTGNKRVIAVSVVRYIIKLALDRNISTRAMLSTNDSVLINLEDGCNVIKCLIKTPSGSYKLLFNYL
nr:hypothetical protein [Rhizoctonia sp.]